ncbi:MAG: hypothetical protein PHC91_09575 [Eubacteriales bacterium]|nr:hypothetical protein [Eubacteriales bacterium]
MDRILSREAFQQEQYNQMDKLKIGLIGISAGAGTSFLAGCLARYLANTGKHSPTVAELGKGSLFDSYGMDKRFAGRQYFRFYQALKENKRIRGMRNPDEGINWILQSPGERGIRLSFEQKLRLVNHAMGDMILCDLSGEQAPDYELLQNMDRILAVIDPMPSKMLGGYEILSNLKLLETEQNDIIFVINKMNNGVNRRQMLQFLNIRKPVFLPMLNPECIYTAEYNCKIPYTAGEAKKVLQLPLGEIAAALFC